MPYSDHLYASSFIETLTRVGLLVLGGYHGHTTGAQRVVPTSYMGETALCRLVPGSTLIRQLYSLVCPLLTIARERRVIVEITTAHYLIFFGESNFIETFISLRDIPHVSKRWLVAAVQAKDSSSK